MRLVKSSGSRWGPGKTHIAAHQHGTHYDVTMCNPDGIYGEFIDGTIDDVTCAKCRLAYNRG